LFDDERDIGVANGKELLALSQAIVDGDPEAVSTARADVVRTMGTDAMVDVVGVASNFERMVRIADATGIELGESLADFSADIRADLDIKRPTNWEI
jgi:hypothetical protein